MIYCNLKLTYTTGTHPGVTDFILPEEDIMFDDAEKALRFNGGFSNFVFTNNYRKKENYIRNVTNTIIFDIDEGMTVKGFIETYKNNFAFAIGTTKSHQKEKNGFVCDRFRVLIPTETAVDLDNEQYSELMREIMIAFPFIDNQCKDAARFYFGNPSAEVYLNYGEFFDWEPYYKMAIERKKMRAERLREKNKNINFEETGTKADWYRKNWLNEKMRRSIKVDDRFIPGNRNNFIYTIARYMKEIELSDGEITEAIEWVNNGELPDNEVKQVLKGLRIET